MGAALIGGAIMQPMHELVHAMSPQLDMMEIACSPNSSLTAAFEDSGYQCQRINFRSGFDLESRKGTQKLRETLDLQRPRLSWVSLWCTRLSSLQNLTPRTELQWVHQTLRCPRDM